MKVPHFLPYSLNPSSTIERVLEESRHCTADSATKLAILAAAYS
jgi:hypothetical protein